MADYYSSAIGASTAIGNSCTSTRWLTEEVFALIDLVQRNEAIYNPRHKYYFCRPYVENFWREVDLKLEKNPGASLAKWTNLRISFRREYTNYLEEKIPPCWTYFDRMFFLHPFLRKKHQQPKSLDSQVQDALVQISSLSNRLQRERAAATAFSNNGNSVGSNIANSTSPSVSQPHQLDNYLEYLDEGDPNTSELDDIIDDDERTLRRRHFVHSILVNDIKSECEDNADDYEHVEARRNSIGNVEQETELDAERDIEPEQDQDSDDHDLRNFILDTIGKRHQQQQQQQRLHHLQRLQNRTFYEEFRAKRAKSQDSHIPPSVTNITTTVPASNSSSNSNSNNITNNVSFVRPTFAKPLEIAGNLTQNHNNVNNILNNNGDISEASVSDRTSASVYHGHFGHSAHNHQHHQHTNRFEFSTLSNNNSNNNNSIGNTTAVNATTAVAAGTVTSVGSTGVASNLIANSTISTPELCDCKTDPDAMFLMSLLPDIQKLNGRDRGKIKIAFQNILQDYLYPD